MIRKILFILFIPSLILLSNSDFVFGGGNMKKAVLIIASNQFQDQELNETYNGLKKSNISVEVASTTLNTVVGMMGSTFKPTMLVSNININDFDAIIFIGGAGADEYWNDSVAHRIAKSAYDNGKVLGAICIAPVTLAKAGLLKGKRATVWDGEKEELTNDGAVYTAADVEKDGNIITASGPFASKNFAETLAKEILSK